MAREQLTQVTVQTETTEATIAGGGEGISHTTTEVISPDESDNHSDSDSDSSPTAKIVGAIASGNEVVNPTTTVHTATTEATIAGGCKGISHTTTKVSPILKQQI